MRKLTLVLIVLSALLLSSCAAIFPNTTAQIEKTPTEVWWALYELGESLLLDVWSWVEFIL